MIFLCFLFLGLLSTPSFAMDEDKKIDSSKKEAPSVKDYVATPPQHFKNFTKPAHSEVVLANMEVSGPPRQPNLKQNELWESSQAPDTIQELIKKIKDNAIGFGYDSKTVLPNSYQARGQRDLIKRIVKATDLKNLEKDTKLLFKLYGFLNVKSEPNKEKFLEKLKEISQELTKNNFESSLLQENHLEPSSIPQNPQVKATSGATKFGPDVFLQILEKTVEPLNQLIPIIVNKVQIKDFSPQDMQQYRQILEEYQEMIADVKEQAKRYKPEQNSEASLKQLTTILTDADQILSDLYTAINKKNEEKHQSRPKTMSVHSQGSSHNPTYRRRGSQEEIQIKQKNQSNNPIQIKKPIR